MSFFHINEKTLKDIIENQKKRDKEAFEKSGQYDDHKLTFLQSFDGKAIIDSDPPLIKEVEHNPEAPTGEVDVLTPHGWARKA